MWVVYFSLAALPLFGIGGWFVPAADPARRSLVFGLLVIYVASGMGLLLATSFLGLRRYLRQRKLEMPLEMTSTWILVGIAMIFATLIVAAILPRPSREYSLSQLPFTVTSAVRRASRFAMGKEGTKDDSGENKATTEAEGGANDGTERREGRPGRAPGFRSTKRRWKRQVGGKNGQGKNSGETGKSQSGGGGKGGKSEGGESKKWRVKRAKRGVASGSKDERSSAE